MRWISKWPSSPAAVEPTSSAREAAPGVRSRVDGELRSLAAKLGRSGSDSPEAAHRTFLAQEIGRYLDRRTLEETAKTSAPLAPPPGQPIGMPGMDYLEGCSWGG